jgi:DNA-binding GntR family transcriptional regulator
MSSSVAGWEPLAGPSMEFLHMPSLREQARRVIRASITAGELRVGEIYSTAYLTNRLGVSATPIREALLDLAGDGLIEIVRNKGFRILVLGEDDLDNIYQVRTMLEVPSVGILARQAAIDNMAELRRLAREIDEHARHADLVANLATDRIFHLRLLAQLGNERLVEVVGRLRDQTIVGVSELLERLRLLDSAQLVKRMDQAGQDHMMLLEAISRHDSAKAERIMHRHLDNSRKLWLPADQPKSSRPRTARA